MKKKFAFIRKVAMTAAYSILVCAAVLLSFRSVFYTLTGTGQETADVLSKLGSRSEEVRQIQSALKTLGFYTGSIDGVYGAITQDAVMRFQRSRGLVADGIAGTWTLNALGIKVTATAAASENDINLLARLISAEARGESYTGQVAVGAVVLNRVKHPSFPNSISAVIYQPQAFSCINDGQFNQPVAESAYRAARDALNNADPTGGAIYYYNPAKTTNKWMLSRPVIVTIGAHVFCS